MADSYTTTLALTKPEIGASRATWGIKLTDDLDKIDAAITQDRADIAARLPLAGGLMTGPITFAAGQGVVLAGGSKIYDGTAELSIQANTDTLRLYNASGTVELLEVSPSTLQFLGVDVLTRGNFTINDYVSTSGDSTINGNLTVTQNLNVAGAISGGSVNLDSKYALFVSGTNASVRFDDTDYLNFNRDTNLLSMTIGGNTAFTIDASGNAWAASNITAFSDKTLKDAFEKVPGVSAIEKLVGYTFNFIPTGKRSAGVIAQDVETIAPELIVTTHEGLKTVNYNGLSAYMIEAIKELSAEIKVLKARLGD